MDIRLSLGETVQGEGRYQPVGGKWGELIQNLLGMGNGVGKGFFTSSVDTCQVL